MLSVLAIVEDTTVDGPGFRTAIYAAGCPNHCPGCHNPESWEITRGTWMETEEVVARVMADEFANVTFSGGDPMFHPEGFTEVAAAIKARSQKTIWCYTGYTYDVDLMSGGKVYTKCTDDILKNIDILVDGEFIEAQKDIRLKFRGSRNQRLIHLSNGKVTLME